MGKFSCRTLREPWTDYLETYIRNDLRDSLRAGIVDARGEFEGDELAAVLVWRWAHDPMIVAQYGEHVWNSHLLAVDVRFRREGRALRIKRWLLDQASAAGISHVVSLVHTANAGMLEINRRLNGISRQAYRGGLPDPDYVWYVVPVPAVRRADG